MALLELKDLHTFFRTKKGIVKAVNGVSYSVEAGRTLGVVGVLHLHPPTVGRPTPRGKV